ncbi:amidinotransferase [Elysia marginata]|uniref:Amidinotransferase n=1 Tax=Elysia marginata TaxID=1093978 RepID=A0AAV4H0J9_9GAST|nr:amidinotransferase [Elysia marginata]
MVRPATFRANEQTISNNYFQKLDNTKLYVNQLAQKEFDGLTSVLEKVGVTVLVYQDTLKPETPDALFPNNWVSFHDCGTLVLYPMYAKNRRWERREEIIKFVEKKGFKVNEIIDYTSKEDQGIFLEGTGSMILDRINKKAYCTLSERSDEHLFVDFCEDMGYLPIVFNAKQTVAGKRLPIYHTNVMMSVATDFAIICLQSIDNARERNILINQLEENGKEIIEITEKQMYNFAGNVLELNGRNGGVLVMSTTAYESLSEDQKKRINKYVSIIYSPIPNIETNGGGGVRCMIAELFLPSQFR